MWKHIRHQSFCYKINNDLVQEQVSDWEEQRFTMEMEELRGKFMAHSVDKVTSQPEPTAVGRLNARINKIMGSFLLEPVRQVQAQ